MMTTVLAWIGCASGLAALAVSWCRAHPAHLPPPSAIIQLPDETLPDGRVRIGDRLVIR